MTLVRKRALPLRPTAVEVGTVPIVVDSTTDDYFVLYVRHDLDADTTVELPGLGDPG